MKYPTRRYLTQSDKTLMWDRWQKGESLHSIACLFERHHQTYGNQKRATPQRTARSQNVLYKQMPHRQIPIDRLSRSR